LAITQVADPVLSVSAGTSNSTVNVTVTDAGTTIYYTTNGQTPTTANSSITSGQTILINQGQTLKVVAYQGSNNPSDVISETYTASGFISSSGGHTVALTAAGTAWGFGNNSSAQLGLGNSSPTTLPTQITKDATQAAFTGIVPFLAQTSATILYQNGLPEPWEIVYFGALGQNPNALSAAGDGYTLLQEAQLGRNPNDYYQGVAPQLSIVSGNGQAGPAGTFLAQPLIVKVSNSAGVGAANAPVNFSVSGGGGISLMNSGAVQTTMSNVRADSSGQVEVYFQVPATANGSDVITVTAGTTAITTIIFNESATPGNAPTVALTPSSSFGTAPASVTLTAATTGTVSNVAFYEGQKLLGTDTTSPYTMALTNVTAGVHSYKAVATNTATGATGQGTASFNATVAEQPFAQYRYTRGGNTPTTDPSFDTFVIALNQIQGTALASTGNSGFTTGSLPWFLSTSNPVAYHISMQNNVPVSTPGGTLDEQLGTYPASEQFQNPIVAFGAAAGGTNTSLYTNQSYAFGFGSGGQTTYNMPDLRIKVYAKSAFTPGTTNVAPVATFNFTLPRQGTAAWTTFAQGGYKMTLPALTSGSTTYPLVTSFQYQPPLFAGGAATTVPGGFGTSPSEGSSPFILTHTDTSPGVPAYYYEIDYEGVSQVETITVSGNNVNELQEPEWMAMASPSTSGTVYATGSSGAYSYGYTMDFTQRPTQLSTFISQPQFQGQPVPQAYANMSVQELLNVSTQVNFQFANPTAAQALTTVNNSPELEDHPVLDKLVTDLGNNPMAIANYVLNNIHLTDALSFDRNGSLTDTSISCGGVDRGAMATYMEQEGNPVEQCGLLIYLLRKAGVPCGYVFPANDSLQMLDQRMSSILRMQLHNAVDINGNQIPMPTPQIIPVNYPWVAAYIGGTNSGGNYTGGTWYHIFPWMKDTSITEGYDLDPLMPGPGSGTPTANSIGYQSGFAWMLNYIQLDPNIMNLSSQWDDPAHLFFPFVTAQLAQYNSTHNTNISLSNIGLTAFDRQNIYTSWTQFPQPWNLTGTLSSANFEPTLAQLDAHDAALSPAVGSIFNTVTIGVGTTVPGSGTGTYIFSPTTVTLPTLDLHDRRLMLRETQTGTNAYTMTLSLAPFNAATGTTGQGSFSGMSSATVNDATDLNMVNKQVLAATNLPASDIEFFIQTTYTRNLNLPNGFSAPSTQWGQYLGVIDENSFSDINFFFSGDLVTYCFDDGAVTQQMLNLHAQNYWNAQQAVLNGSTPSDPDDLMGEPVYLMGLSLHNAVDNFRQQTMALYKTTQVSYFRDGTAKMEAARTTSDTLPGGVITLQYPAFDITQGVLASAAYNSANANTGVPYPQDAAYVVAAGSSADEATVINQFFNETGTASTTHVLQVAQKAYLAGNGTTPPAPPYLTSQNYSTFGATNYTAMVNGSNVTQPLSTWAGGTGSGTVWSTISANEQSNPYAFAYLTPGAVTAANGSYTGMGYLIGDGYGDVESLLENNAQLGEAGGGNGQGLPSPYNITTAPSGASSPSAWPLTYNGSFYTLGDLAPTSGNILGYFAGSDGSFSVAFDDAAIANGSDVEDLFSLEANFAANLQMSYIPSGSTVPTTPAPTAAQAVNVQTGGWFGQASFSSVANKILQTVGEPVDAIEGGFHVDETDLTMPGPLPIQLQRHYYSLNQADNEFGYGWTLSYEPYLVVGAGSSPIIYATEMDGSVIAYSQKSGSTTTWIPLAANNPSLANQHGNQAGGLTNLFNNVITLSGTTYTLTGADGSVRTYTVSQYPNGTGTYEVTRSRPYLTSWTDPQGNTLTFTIQTDSTKIDYGKLNRIASSNGNYIQLDYDNFGHILTAIASDGRQCSYTYNTYGDLTSVTRTDGSVVSYAYDSQPQTVNGATQNYSDHLLIQENKPNGRQLVNTYNTYPDRRVHTQQSTVGTAGALATTATFVYTTTATNSDGTINGNTTVADAYGRITTYTYSESEITKIQDPSPLTTSISQMWYQTTNGSGAYNRSLQQTVDKRGLTQNFLYDANGNRKETDTVGDLTGSGASSTHTVTATYNAQNLPTLVTDTSTGDNTAFAYTSSLSPYLCTQMQSFASGGAVSTTTYTYGNVTGPPFANGLLESAVVAGSSGTQAETDYAYNNQGYSTSEKIYSETNDPNVTYTFSYNPTGQLVKKTDSAGRFTQLGYDALGNLIAEENYDHSGNLMGWNYNYFDQNGELQWTEGPRINPDDYTYRSYDGAGRLNQLLQYRSQANSTGTGVVQATGNGFIGTTSYSYDLFGDQTLMMDANGNTVVSGYDSIGRLTSRAYYDSGSNLKATEGFTYDTNQSGDKVATYTNPLGGVTQFFYTQTGELTKQINPDNSTEQWFYQLDGRLSKEIYRNGSNRTLAYNDASLVVTSAYQDVSGNSLTTQSQGYDCRGNLISSVDGEGFLTSSTFDGLDRVKSVTGPPAANGSAAQQLTYSYDSAGITDIATDSLGESTVTTYDALYRPVQININSSSGATVRSKGFSYSPDHQSVTSFDGTNTNVTTTWTDIQGSPVLVQNADGTFSTEGYDSNENATSSTDALNRTTNFTFDGLNRVIQQQLPDGALIAFGYDNAGNLTSRGMPNNLNWSATYNSSSLILSEKLMQGTNNTTRSYGYQYYPSGNNIGELQTVSDPRTPSIVSTYSYDGFNRVKSVAAVDPSSAQLGVTQNYKYDNRGLLTELDQSYQNSALSPPTSIIRSYDGYGAILTEQVYLNGSLKDTWVENHDGAGRRTQLTEFNHASKPFGYQYQADGSLTETSFNSQNYLYAYGLDGLLNTRTTPFNTQSVVSRDSVGRVLEQKQVVGSTTYLDEKVQTSLGASAWRGDSTQGNYIATRTGTGAWNETRSYGYDDSTGQRGHLLTESFAPSSGTSSTLTYQFDGNTTGGLGQRTSAALTSGPLTGGNSSTYSTFARLSQQTVSGSLVQPPAIASPVNDTSYDLTGELTSHNPGSNADTLTWDALGRLVSMKRNPTGNGFSWSAVYDGFGRRQQTNYQAITGGTNSGSPLVTQSSFDPDVQFLEAAVTVNGTREWMVHGPDVDGGYGDLQGTGGVDAVVNDSTSTATGVFSDIYGHAVATVSGTTVTWNTVRSSSYGPQPGTTALPLDGVHDVSTFLNWHGRYVDGTGFYNLGNRLYDPSSGTFLSADPLGHAASMDLYSYAGGDPVNYYDPQGLVATKFGQTVDRGLRANRWIIAPEDLSAIEAFPQQAYDAFHYSPSVLDQSRINQTLALSAQNDGGFNPDTASGTMALGVEDLLAQSSFFAAHNESFLQNTRGGLDIASSATIVGLEGHAAYNIASAPIQSQAINLPGSVELTGVQLNKLIGDTTADAIAARYPFALREVPINTVGGKRILDVVVVGGAETLGIESKVGKTVLSNPAIRQELARDWWLLRQGQVDTITWEFTPSPITGKVGPDAALQAMLDKLGIKTIINQ
jgi:RHS repeat-associated protein